MCAALGRGDVRDHAPPHHPARRMGTAGTAVQARGSPGLGVVKQPRALVPHVFQQTPTARLLAAGRDARPRHADTWGRAVETRHAEGVTARYRRLAATRAPRRPTRRACPAPAESARGGIRRLRFVWQCDRARWLAAVERCLLEKGMLAKAETDLRTAELVSGVEDEGYAPHAH
jgi:hypothetical protein